MQTIVFTAVLIFISTSIDDLVLLLLFQAQAEKGKERLSILGGQFVGIGALVVISLFGAYFATRLLEGWAVGLLGLLPLFLGIKSLVSKDKEEKSQNNQKKNLLATVSIVTIASGRDNVASTYPGSPSWKAVSYSALVVFTLMILSSLPFQLFSRHSQVRLLLTRFSSVLVTGLFSSSTPILS